MNKFTYLKDINFDQPRYYIGASDVPTLALLNKKYGHTPLSLWKEKTGRGEPKIDNERMKAGKELEPLILKWGMEKLIFESINKKLGLESIEKDDKPIKELKPYRFRKDFLNKFLLSRTAGENQFFNYFSQTECRHSEHKFICSHADLIQEDFIMEAKSTGYFGGKRKDINSGYDEEDTSANGIPSTVYLQVQTQMLCYDIPVCYVSVMIDTGTHRLYGPIPANKKTQEKIIALCQRFWWCVENDKPPKPETWKDIQYLNPDFDKHSKTVIGGEKEEEAFKMKARAETLREKQKKIKEELDDIKNAVGLLIGEQKYLESSSGEKLATAFNVEKYFLKNYKKMSKRRFDGLVKDGFITKSEYRDIRF